MRDIQAVQRVNEFTPGSEPMRHIEQSVALKKLGKAVGEDQVFENAK
jgi:hypothetical protein